MAKKILIIDDEPTFCKYLSDFLRSEGYDIAVASDGVEAEKMIETERPDILTVDLIMPRLNGHALIQKLKRDRKPFIFIVITADNLPHMEEFLLDEGAFAVLHKPLNLKELIDTIKLLETDLYWKWYHPE